MIACPIQTTGGAAARPRRLRRGNARGTSGRRLGNFCGHCTRHFAAAAGIALSMSMAGSISSLSAAPLETNYLVDSWTTRHGLPHPTVRWLAQTPDGFLWAGTLRGLTRFDGGRFKNFDPTTTPALRDGHIRSIGVDAEGALWVLGENGSVVRREHHEFVTVAGPDGAWLTNGHGLYSDGGKTFVVSDTHGHVRRLEGERLVDWFSATPAATAATGPFIGINLDFDATVWVRHGSTLHWRNGERWERVVAPDGSDFAALKTGPSQAGGMWVSGADGLRRLRRGDWEPRFLAYEAPVSSVQAILEDRSGNVWVSLVGGQLFRFDPGGRLTQLHQHPALANDMVKHFLQDADGDLWLAKEGGLSRLRLRSPAQAPRTEDRMPKVVLEEALADGRSMVLSPAAATDGAHIFPAGARMLEFRYTAVAFDAPERVQFRSKLEGLDAGWTTSLRRVATYSNLPPGRYYFRLAAGRGGNGGGAWNDREVTVAVVVQPHLWQTWWFRAGGALALLGAIVVAWQRRETLRRRERAQQDQFCRQLIESQENERQRIARELHDSLGQNLLLIKNRAVLGLKDSATQEKMREQLREISQASTDSVEEIRAIARALRPYQLDQLGLTKAVQDVVASVGTSGGLRLEAQVDDIDGLFAPELEISLYRIVQEGLNNVLKHAEARSARLTVRRAGSSISVELADDGRGFGPALQDGFGLTSVRERVRLLGGMLEVKSAPDQGTRLQVTIPVPARTPTPTTPTTPTPP